MTSSLFQKYDQVKLYLLATVIAFLPYYMHISNVLIGLCTVLTISKMINKKSWNFRQLSILSISFLSYFILEIMGLLYTAPENLHIGFSALEKHQAFILVPFIFSDFEIDFQKREVLFLTFVASSLIAVIVCVIANMYQGVTLYDQYFHEWLFTHDRFSEPIGLQAVYFSLYIGLSLLILLDFYFNGIKMFSNAEGKGFSGIVKDSIVLLFVILFAALVTLGSRTVIASVVLIIIAYLLQYAFSKKAYKVLVAVVVIPLLLIGLIFINPVVKTRFIDLQYNKYQDSKYGSYLARLEIWRPGVEAIKENIWIGVGTGDHQAEMNKKYEKYNYSEGIRLSFNMHNQYLQSMLNHGLFGLLILMCIFGVQVRQGFRNHDWLYLAFLGIFMLASLTESTLVRNKGILFLVMFSFVFFNYKTGISKSEN